MIQSRRFAAFSIGLGLLAACAPSVQQEVEIGNQAVAEINQTMPIVQDAGVQANLDGLVAPLRRVITRQDLPWSFRVVNSDQINAFAVPGGHIYVFSGLIKQAGNYDEFMGVVAHEMGHVELRHSAEQMGQASAANTGVGLLYALLGRQPSGAESVALNVAAGAAFAKFSRDDEREADSVAVGYLTRSGVNPRGITDMFQELQQVQQSQPSKVEQWFSSHPMTGERIENVNRIIATTPGAQAALRTGKVHNSLYAEFKRRVHALPAPPK